MNRKFCILALASIATLSTSTALAAERDSYWFEKESFTRWEDRAVNELHANSETLSKLTPESFQAMDQEQLDLIFALLQSGPIPHGKFNGSIVIAKGGPIDFLAKSVGPAWSERIRGGIERFGQWIWKGKVFNRATRVLQNRISLLPGLERLWFPAKLYCGQSRLDSRRESVIIDYAYNDTIDAPSMYSSEPAFGGSFLPELRMEIDRMVGRDGMNIRDEVRMVSPGLYLGRAYLNNVFALNFVLKQDNPEESGSVFANTESDCWSSEQKGIQASTR